MMLIREYNKKDDLIELKMYEEKGRMLNSYLTNLRQQNEEDDWKLGERGIFRSYDNSYNSCDCCESSDIFLISTYSSQARSWMTSSTIDTTRFSDEVQSIASVFSNKTRMASFCQSFIPPHDKKMKFC